MKSLTYRPPTRAERAEKYANKMLWKAGERMRRYDGRRVHRALANLSRNHPDYGCTPAEHEHRKAERGAA
jgi:hypothetical protein